ncbi:uncharacterized protein LOC134786831 [Penaeus indicus]|uniref:uncharacterized protein LOC134786831 n=1 Tax=Penaeus indicus TaxID=29960 RepID=UPI00300C5965
MALHGRPQTLLVSAALVATCGFLLLVPRIASGHKKVHTNAPYNKSVHGNPVVKYVNLHIFVETYVKDERLIEDLSSNKTLSVEKGTLGYIPVPKCEEEYNPCPFGPDGMRRKLTARTVKQTVIMYFKNTNNNKIERKEHTYEVDAECICEK